MLVREGLRLEEPEGTPPALWQIIDRCWKSNLKERWKFVELTAALEAHARSVGIDRVVLSTGSVMTPAQKLRVRQGPIRGV